MNALRDAPSVLDNWITAHMIEVTKGCQDCTETNTCVPHAGYWGGMLSLSMRLPELRPEVIAHLGGTQVGYARIRDGQVRRLDPQPLMDGRPVFVFPEDGGHE